MPFLNLIVKKTLHIQYTIFKPLIIPMFVNILSLYDMLIYFTNKRKSLKKSCVVDDYISVNSRGKIC